MGEEAWPGLRERVVALPRLRAHVVEAGAGPAVLLLHGFPQSSREWSRVTPLVAQHAQVIAPDLRGFGRSEAPDASYRLDALREDAVALLNALDVERAVVVGHDIGALVALSLAMEHPRRVSHLVVLSIPPMYLRVRPSMARSMRSLWFQYALATPRLGARLLRGGRQRLPRWILAEFAQHGGVPAADADAYLASLREPARARAGSRVYRELVVPEFLRIVRGAYRDRLPTMPTLVLLGADDDVLPRDALDGVEQHARDLRIEEVPRAGHWLVDEQPVEVARRIVEFAGLTREA